MTTTLTIHEVGLQGLAIQDLMKPVAEIHEYAGPIPRVGEFYSQDSDRVTSYWIVIGVVHRHLAEVHLFVKLTEVVQRDELGAKTPLVVKKWM